MIFKLLTLVRCAVRQFGRDAWEAGRFGTNRLFVCLKWVLEKPRAEDFSEEKCSARGCFRVFAKGSKLPKELLVRPKYLRRAIILHLPFKSAKRLSVHIESDIKTC